MAFNRKNVLVVHLHINGPELGSASCGANLYQGLMSTYSRERVTCKRCLAQIAGNTRKSVDPDIARKRINRELKSLRRDIELYGDANGYYADCIEKEEAKLAAL